MTPVAISSAVRPKAQPCVHCGTLLSQPPSEGLQFCCKGCEQVYALIQARGLSRYYNWVEGLTLRPPSGEVKHGASLEQSFLDDPTFLSLYTSTDPNQLDFYIEGAHCAACVWLLERTPEFLNDLQSVRLDLSTSVATVTRKPGGSFARVAAEFEQLGYPAHPVLFEQARTARERTSKNHLCRLGVAGACAGNIMLLAVGLYAGANGNYAGLFTWTSLLLFIPILTYCATPFYLNSWRALKAGRISIDLPIVLGLWFGTAISLLSLLGFQGASGIYFDSLSALIFLLLGGRFVLQRVQAQALNSARLAQFLVPSRTRRWDHLQSRFLEVRAEVLKLGDRIQVMPGEYLPADGTLLTHSAQISTAFLTGEPETITYSQGASLLSGSLNHAQSLELRVVALGAETRLGRILKATEESLTRRAPISLIADRVGQWFIFFTLILVTLGFFLGLPQGLVHAVDRALTVAIVVCPCFFAFSIPIIMGRTLTRLARAGIIVKGPDVLEKLASIREVVFDKTGTLTEGHPEVTAWDCEPTHQLQTERAVFALESHSQHPVAGALRRYLLARVPVGLADATEALVETPGVGISGRVFGHDFKIIADHGRGHGSAVYRDQECVARVSLGDRLRPESRLAVLALQTHGLGVSILSGDGPKAVDKIAQELGLEPALAQSVASPSEKARIIATKQHCLMVGDGANDATALATAQVGVAVRGGMEISLRAADVYCGRGGVKYIPALIIAGQETLRLIRRSLAFSLLYNTAAISVALTGNLTPLFAAVLMPMSTLTVLFISLVGTKKLRRTFLELSR